MAQAPPPTSRRRRRRHRAVARSANGGGVAHRVTPPRRRWLNNETLTVRVLYEASPRPSVARGACPGGDGEVWALVAGSSAGVAVTLMRRRPRKPRSVSSSAGEKPEHS